MNCAVCNMPSEKETCSSECLALLCLVHIEEQSTTSGCPEAYPGMFADEHAQLLWDIKKRCHEVRGLPFNEPTPKTAAMKFFEAYDIINVGREVP